MSASRRNQLPIESMERQLDRLLTFYPRIDAKVSALFAVTSAQIAIAALNLTPGDFSTWWMGALATVFALCAVWVIVHLYRCAYPHLEGGQQSLIYFVEIAGLRESDYISRLCSVDEAEYRNDVAGQVWRNGQILCLKYRFLKRATVGACASVVPWAALLIATSLAHSQLPILGK